MIKLTNILNEIIEAKQVGTLYHFTSYLNALKIIEGGFILKPYAIGSGMDINKYISLTRSKNLNDNTNSVLTVSKNVRFAIDGNILSSKYKIEPHADTKSGYGRTTQDESEERILATNYGGKVDIKNALQSIEIQKPVIAPNSEEDEEMGYTPPFLSHYMDLINYLKTNNIPYKIVDKY